jgi:hypothetical protein
MLDINHSTQFDIDTTINDGHTLFERVLTLEDQILDLLKGEFAGVLRSHVRGEVYGGR